MDRPVAPLRCLVVEDEVLLAMDITAMIEDAGHIVVAEAASLNEVRALDADIMPHIAFVDIQLAEGSSGIDVCAYIRRQWVGTIIIFVTANPKKLPSDYAGGHGVISKPFSRTGIMSTMRYLGEGICAPPPSTLQPATLTAAPSLAEAWVH